jgi:hypothetical protein
MHSPFVAVKRGITRSVLLIGNYAIKVPRLKKDPNSPIPFWRRVIQGLQSNIAERDQRGNPAVAPLVCSVLGGLLQVYVRCKPYTGVAVRLEDMAKLTREYGKPIDAKKDNLGYLNGRIVLLDYDIAPGDCPNCRRHYLPR